MKKDYGNDKLSAVDAKFEAQKLAFAPMAFMAAKVLRDTGILKMVAQNPDNGATADEIAKTLNLKKYSVEVLLDAGLSSQLVYMRNEHYVLTKTGHFIQNDRLTRINMDFVADVCYKGMWHLQEAIETNTPAGLKELGDWPTIYHGLPELSEKAKKSWFDFDHYYSDGVFESVLPTVLPRKNMRLLDVGGNWIFRRLRTPIPEIAGHFSRKKICLKLKIILHCSSKIFAPIWFLQNGCDKSYLKFCLK